MTTQDTGEEPNNATNRGFAAQQQPQMGGAEAESGALGATSESLDPQAERLGRAQLDSEFIDIDPCLKSLKGGYLMQRTFVNTKMGSSGGAQDTKIGTSLTQRKSPRRFLSRTLDTGSGGGDSTTEAASSRAALQKGARFGGKGTIGFGTAGAGPACNYQNVDLFTIPDGIKLGKDQRRQRSHRMSQIENNRTFATLELDHEVQLQQEFAFAESDGDLAKRSALTEIEPDQLIQDAIIEAKFQQQLRRQFGPTKGMMQTTMTGGGYASSQKWDDMRAQTEIHSVYNAGSGSPHLRPGAQSGQHTQGAGFQQHLLGASYNITFDDNYKSPQVSDVSFPTIPKPHQTGKDGQFNSHRFIRHHQHSTPNAGPDTQRAPYDMHSTTIGFGAGGGAGADTQDDANLDEDSQFQSQSKQKVGMNLSATSFTNKDAFSRVSQLNKGILGARGQHASKGGGHAGRAGPGSGQGPHDFADDEQDRTRRTPILHMQFDELASHQLHNTFTNRFIKNDQLQRRNPRKYMRNPNEVFGMTQGALQYTWRDQRPAKLVPQKAELGKMRGTSYSTDLREDGANRSSFWLGQGFNSTQRSTANQPGIGYPTGYPESHRTTFNATAQAHSGMLAAATPSEVPHAQPGNIKVRNLARQPPGPEGHDDVMEPVPQLSGRGLSVSPARERPSVLNNVIKPFRATSEVDRQRATQILDYIVQRRKMVGKRQEEADEAKTELEHKALLGQIEDDKRAKQRARSKRSSDGNGTAAEGASDFDEFDKDDKYGSVLQKDLDRITGGMQVVRECKLDLDVLEKLVGTPEEGKRPTQGKMKFLVDQLEQNKFFKDKVDAWDKKIDKIIDNQPAIQKYDLKGKIKETMLEMSPVRKAKQEVEINKVMAKRTLINPVSILANRHSPQKPDHAKGLAQNNIVLMNEADLNDSFDRTLPDTSKPAGSRFKTDTSRDVFTAMNKSLMEKREEVQGQRLARMRKYGRWLFYEGVDHLPKDKKKVYQFEQKRQEERRKARESAVKREQAGRLDSGKRQSGMSKLGHMEPTMTIGELGNETSREDSRQASGPGGNFQLKKETLVSVHTGTE